MNTRHLGRIPESSSGTDSDTIQDGEAEWFGSEEEENGRPRTPFEFSEEHGPFVIFDSRHGSTEVRQMRRSQESRIDQFTVDTEEFMNGAESRGSDTVKRFAPAPSRLFFEASCSAKKPMHLTEHSSCSLNPPTDGLLGWGFANVVCVP